MSISIRKMNGRRTLYGGADTHIVRTTDPSRRARRSFQATGYRFRTNLAAMFGRKSWSRFAPLVVSVASVVPTAAMVAACGDDASDGTMKPSDASIDRERLSEPLRPDASCEVVIETPELLPATHLPEGTVITYNSNPPSSGPHYPIWANFQEYAEPIEWPYLVHSLEHGAILLLYKTPCAAGIADDGPNDDADASSADDAGASDGGASGACAPVVEALREVRDSLSSDPLCDPSIRVRVVIAPAPDLDVPVAAAAWGWTYKAACADLPTLEDFARAHYAQGPENICAPGRTF